MADGGDTDNGRLWANDMPAGDFDALRGTYRALNLRCVNPQCGGALYPRRSALGRQLFAHMPGTLESCPERTNETGESLTHLNLKNLIASIGEAVGYRAEIEERLGRIRRRPDVQLFRSDMPKDYGPIVCAEIQHSPIGLATLDRRDRELNAALSEYHSEPADRRVVPWFTTGEQSWSSIRAHIQLAETAGGGQIAVQGITQFHDPDSDHFVMPLEQVMAEMKRNLLVRLDDARSGGRWARMPAATAPARRVAKRTPEPVDGRPSPECNRRTHAGPQFGRGYIGWVSRFCPGCSGASRVRLLVDRIRMAYCPICGYEGGITAPNEVRS